MASLFSQSKALVVSTLLGLSIIPALFYNGVYADYLLVTYTLLFAVLAVVSAVIVKQDTMKFSLGPFLYLLLGFWVLAFMNCFSSLSFFSSYNHFWTLGAFPLTFLLVAASYHDGMTQHIAKIICAIMIGLCFWAFYQVFTEPVVHRFRAHGPYFNPNLFAGFLNLAILPLAAYYVMGKTSGAKSNVLLAIIIILMAGMFSSVSMGGTISLLCGAVLLFALFWKYKAMNYKRAGLLIGIGGALYGFFHLFYYSFRELAATNAAESMGQRSLIWQQSLPMALEEPVFGIGLANFRFLYPQFREVTEKSQGYFTHMDPLQFTIEMGFLAPVLFYGLLIAGLVRTLKVYNLDKEQFGQKHIYVIGLFCGISALLIHTHFTFHLYILPNLIALGIACGLWYAISGELIGANKEWSLSKPAKTMFCVLAGLFMIIGLHGASLMSVTERIYNSADAKLQENGDIEAYVGAINSGSLYALGQDPNAYLKIAGIQTAMLKEPNLPSEQKKLLLQSTLGLFDKAQSLNPYDPTVYYNRGVFYESLPAGLVTDATQKAIEQWQEASRLNSRFDLASQKLDKYFAN